MKTELTITVRIDKDAFDEAKRKSGGSIREDIEEALADVFATPVTATRWSAKHEEEE